MQDVLNTMNTNDDDNMLRLNSDNVDSNSDGNAGHGFGYEAVIETGNKK